MKTTKKINHLKILRNTQVSPSLRIPQGVQVSLLGFFISFGLGLLISHSASAFSASISRVNSGTISLGSIKPSYAGTLGTGSDVVTVSSNCSAGYNLYVSATKDGSTSLTTDGGKDYIPSTTTATGSEATLSKDTWGIGKNGTTFSKIPAYTTDTSSLAPLYAGTGDASNTAQDYTIYYGVNVSTAKTPGTYTGDILYTVLMNSACISYTLNFDGNSATTNTLESKELEFDSTIDLAEISSSNKIARTGYTLTGWKDQDGNSYGITGIVDVNPTDTATVTLTAEWQINKHTVTINKGSNVTTVSGVGPYDYNTTATISATTFATGYHFSGWTVNSGSVTLYSNSSMTTASTTSTPAYFRMPDQNVTLTANAAANTYTIAYAAGNTGGSCSVSSTAAAYDQNVTLSSTKCTKSGAEQKGWSTSNSASNTKTYNLGQVLTKPNLTSANGGTVTLYPYFEGIVADCSSSNKISATNGCKLADGKVWIYGLNGSTTTWTNICDYPGSAGLIATCTKNTSLCPEGYTFPTMAVQDNLVVAYGGTSYGNYGRHKIYNSSLYNALSLSSSRNFWNSTTNISGWAHSLQVSSSQASAEGQTQGGNAYVLCYKNV